MRKIGSTERGDRLGRRHHLAAPAVSVEKAAGDLVGLHSSDPVTVYLSSWATVGGFEVGDLEDALYQRRSLVRILGMRRTLFVVPIDLAVVIDSCCTRAFVPTERRRLIRLVEAQKLAEDGAAWLKLLEERIMEALAVGGEVAAVELTREIPELGLQIRFGEGKTWEGTMGVSTRLLMLLATEARVVRAAHGDRGSRANTGGQPPRHGWAGQWPDRPRRRPGWN